MSGISGPTAIYGPQWLWLGGLNAATTAADQWVQPDGGTHLAETLEFIAPAGGTVSRLVALANLAAGSTWTLKVMRSGPSGAATLATATIVGAAGDQTINQTLSGSLAVGDYIACRVERTVGVGALTLYGVSVRVDPSA